MGLLKVTEMTRSHFPSYFIAFNQTVVKFTMFDQYDAVRMRQVCAISRGPLKSINEILWLS